MFCLPLFQPMGVKGCRKLHGLYGCLMNSFCRQWLQMIVLLHVQPIQCDACMHLYLWLRPYQDTGLCIQSFIHP